VRFPCARVTKVVFGGTDMRTAFATTARVGLGPRELEDQPLAGALFTFPVEVPGVAIQELRLGSRL
jgi:sugar lactone lactonase YvrE